MRSLLILDPLVRSGIIAADRISMPHHPESLECVRLKGNEIVWVGHPQTHCSRVCKVALISAVSKALVKDKNLHAGNAVKAAATVAGGGGGGGRPDMAEAGAKLVEKLDAAIAAGAAELRKQLEN